MSSKATIKHSRRRLIRRPCRACGGTGEMDAPPRCGHSGRCPCGPVLTDCPRCEGTGYTPVAAGPRRADLSAHLFDLASSLMRAEVAL